MKECVVSCRANRHSWLKFPSYLFLLNFLHLHWVKVAWIFNLYFSPYDTQSFTWSFLSVPGPVCLETNPCSHNPCKIGEKCVVTSTYFKCECMEHDKCDPCKWHEIGSIWIFSDCWLEWSASTMMQRYPSLLCLAQKPKLASLDKDFWLIVTEKEFWFKSWAILSPFFQL